MKPQPTILIIGDEPVIHDTLEALLCVDFDVQFAENGANGIFAALQIQPDMLQYIQEQSGKHFDPHLVELFLVLRRTE